MRYVLASTVTAKCKGSDDTHRKKRELKGGKYFG